MYEVEEVTREIKVRIRKLLKIINALLYFLHCLVNKPKALIPLWDTRMCVFTVFIVRNGDFKQLIRVKKFKIKQKKIIIKYSTDLVKISYI